MLYDADGERLLNAEEQREEDAFMQVVVGAETTEALRELLKQCEHNKDKSTYDMVAWELRRRGA